MLKNLLAVYNLGHTRGQCSGIGNPVFVPAVDSRGRETPSFDGGTLLSACGLLDRVIHRSGRTPLLPLYALLLFNAPEVLTLRTLYELPEFGGGAGRRRKENLQGVPQTVFYTLALSRFFHAAIMYFTSRASFDQYSQLFIEIKPISCESSIKNRSSLQ